MINFPFFQHQVIKLVFFRETEVNEDLIDEVAKLLIRFFNLEVVKEEKHRFDNNGLTKFWILSQSHLVIHSWPENNALHVDLMTCSPSVITLRNMKRCLSPISANEIFVKKLKY